ncbi:hypothetical protein XA68_12699 [Ophiocordyceps unilateralis]|uniref:MYND-type domain-containing protein n=1 Tax=Ophiocordyceps unilateralis TaxID=268505 RepID=A0A2A9PMA0_OPHUN|nr:hypothetical protein XA68_12699 [Ophiocordyceps unilateralis]
MLAANNAPIAPPPTIIVTPPSFRRILRPLPRPSCAALAPDGERPCQGEPLIACPNCHLVAYCNNDCRARHWKRVHKFDCKQQFQEELAPGWTRKSLGALGDHLTFGNFFWAGYAATDVLQLEKNEGPLFSERLDLLFGGTAGVRHFIYSIYRMVETARPQLFVVLTESDDLQFLRTFLALHLLSPNGFDPVVNAEAVIHMWYSARLTKRMYVHISAVVRSNSNSIFAGREYFNPVLTQVMVWGDTRQRFEADMSKAQWKVVFDFLNNPLLDMSSYYSYRRAKDKENLQSANAILTRMERCRAMTMSKWLDDGLLLPYGQSRTEFNVLNPVFFNLEWQYPFGATAEPLSEWPLELLDHDSGPATNDVYGKAFFYLHNMLMHFQNRLTELTVTIRLACVHNSVFNDPVAFHCPFKKLHDRIEIADSWDEHPLSAIMFSAKILRHHEENPYATLLMLTSTSVNHGLPSVYEAIDKEAVNLFSETSTALDQLAPPVLDAWKNPRAAMRRALGLLMWRNWNKFSSSYLLDPEYYGFNLLLDLGSMDRPRSVLQTGIMGLQLRDKHIITQPWPNRHVYHDNAKPSAKDFDRWISWPCLKPQRWLEWKRVGDVEHRVWWDCLGRAYELSAQGVTDELKACVRDFRQLKEDSSGGIRPSRSRKATGRGDGTREEDGSSRKGKAKMEEGESDESSEEEDDDDETSMSREEKKKKKKKKPLDKGKGKAPAEPSDDRDASSSAEPTTPARGSRSPDDDWTKAQDSSHRREEANDDSGESKEHSPARSSESGNSSYVSAVSQPTTPDKCEKTGDDKTKPLTKTQKKRANRKANKCKHSTGNEF